MIMCFGYAVNLAVAGISRLCHLLHFHLANLLIAKTGLWLIDVSTANKELTKSFPSSEACG